MQNNGYKTRGVKLGLEMRISRQWGKKPLIDIGVVTVRLRVGEIGNQWGKVFRQCKICWVSNAFFDVLADHSLVFLTEGPLRVKDEIPRGKAKGNVFPKEYG